jgi:beta-phosphoglucomutase-like phosphatase (HAD superfamily)
VLLALPVVGSAKRPARHASLQLQVATLTNYTVSFSQGALGHAGLDALVDTPLDIGAVQRWKPHPATYKFAAKQLGLELEEASPSAAPSSMCMPHSRAVPAPCSCHTMQQQCVRE